LIALAIFFLMDWINLWSSLILIGFYFVNCVVLVMNMEIKEKILELFGIENEDLDSLYGEHF
jgi:hypothetical protein